MAAVAEAAQCRGRVVEAEHRVDRRPDSVALDRAAHRLEAGAAADAHAGEPCALAVELADVERRLAAGDEADAADRAAVANRGERLGERRRAADLDHAVDAAAGERVRAPSPVR